MFSFRYRPAPGDLDFRRVAADVAASPALYPYALDPIADAAQFVRMSADAYAQASFLDARAVPAEAARLWAPLGPLEREAEVAALPERLGWIFHIGHVGSTLLSRLLGALPGGFSLREPAPLQTLAAVRAELGAPESLWTVERWRARVDLFLKLWSRRFEPGAAPVVKATSWTCDLAPELMTRPAAPQAVCLTMGPQAWLASILASPGGLEDVDGAAQSALRRLHRRLRAAPWRLVDLSPGERAAMTWACETAALAEAGRYAGGRLLWLDFDRFLDDPRAGLTRAAEQFDLPADAEAVEAVCSGPILTRYSKQPDVAFGPEDRKRKLDDARMRHVVEIRRGLNWLDRACADYPEIAAARAEAAAARD